jgi:flagellar biosynthesis protein FlhF
MMQSQTFRASNVMAALEKIQQELGPDAVVVSVRQVPSGPLWQAWREPGVEVVATSRNQGLLTRQAIKPKPLEQPVKAALPPKPAPVPQKGNSVTPSSALQHILERLGDQGVDAGYLEQVSNTYRETLSAQALQDENHLLAYLRQQLMAHLRVRKENSVLTEHILVLVGPSGSGKTATMAKIAAFHNRGLRRRVTWICADTFNTGAIEEARVYSGALGIPLRTVYTPPEFISIVSEAARGDLILIDTPGINPYKESSLVELGEFLTALPERTTYLVASANHKDRDLMRSYTSLSPIGIDGLVFTHLDETNTYGNLFNLARVSKLPVTYCCSGTKVPQDLSIAQTEHLAALLLGESRI